MQANGGTMNCQHRTKQLGLRNILASQPFLVADCASRAVGVRTPTLGPGRQHAAAQPQDHFDLQLFLAAFLVAFLAVVLAAGFLAAFFSATIQTSVH